MSRFAHPIDAACLTGGQKKDCEFYGVYIGLSRQDFKEPLNKSRAGATKASRDGMRERRRREWCDRVGRSSTFRRKMRPRSGMRGTCHVGSLTNSSAALPALRGKRVITQLLQYFPRRSWEFVQFHHHILQR